VTTPGYHGQSDVPHHLAVAVWVPAT